MKESIEEPEQWNRISHILDYILHKPIASTSMKQPTESITAKKPRKKKLHTYEQLRLF